MMERKSVSQLRCRVVLSLALVLMVLAPVTTAADELTFSLSGGRVTIVAEDVPVLTILAEWGRVGSTAIIDADELDNETVTLELVDVPEAQALRTLLRGAAGYMAAPRAATVDGASRFDRILIMATSKAAPRVAATQVRTAPTAAPSARQAGGQRLGAIPNAQRGRTPFTATAAQQEQLDQLQQLLQQSDDSSDDEPELADVRPVFGNQPANRPGLPMGTADGQEAAGVPTGAFGTPTSVDGAQPGVFGSTTAGQGRGDSDSPSPVRIRRP
jgi:hypothetical protein